ncbi:MAG TPA: hybrid sensor histidine kinase/response regulator [Cyanobacteria bacterium UBA12227]|nr:hybrid sensor histidine kinase/response regulator [Cyanobacteria bacterium UBA12227]HAX87016.1 hybrid sensor histidine kinase/response regulator [Cyanobacteria bacterium UBA11370]HBY75575.1 hybrid sensor histidine kinase/response regulator [Cyanobacteria bacterium UBA11148]
MSNIKILVVEDEEIVALDIESTLKSLGYNVLDVVASAEEAIATVAKIQPDLVLMDIMLKGSMDGIQAAEKIAQHFPIPVIYLTAYADLNTLERAKLTAPFGYLLKPFEEKELQTTIEIALSRYQAEQLMRQALEKEKELNDLKSKFIAIASHEFRNPLTTISSSINLLKHYCRDCLDSKKSKHFHQIETSVEQIKNLLDDVLLIGKADAGKLELHPVPLDLLQFCRDLVEELQLNAGATYHVAFTAQGQFTNIQIDPNLLRHILTNLISNAIKYSPKGGIVNFGLSGEDKRVTFRIQDWGIGIPLEDQQQLFESFHRASNVGSIEGTGLGLSIVKRCVDVHQGQISVDSTIGVGTTFTVTLPLI